MFIFALGQFYDTVNLIGLHLYSGQHNEFILKVRSFYMRVFGQLLKKNRYTLKKKEKKVSYFSMGVPYLPVSFLETYPLGIFTQYERGLDRVFRHCQQAKSACHLDTKQYLDSYTYCIYQQILLMLLNDPKYKPNFTYQSKKSTSCSSSRSRFNSHHPYGSSEGLMPNSGLNRHCTHTAHRNAETPNT